MLLIDIKLPPFLLFPSLLFALLSDLQGPAFTSYSSDPLAGFLFSLSLSSLSLAFRGTLQRFPSSNEREKNDTPHRKEDEKDNERMME